MRGYTLNAIKIVAMKFLMFGVFGGDNSIQINCV